MKSLGLQQMANVSLSAAVSCPAKPKPAAAKAKAKAPNHQQTYSLRSRAGSAAAVLDQSQPEAMQVCWTSIVSTIMESTIKNAFPVTL